MDAYEGKTERLKPVCPLCEGPMEQGYVVDRSDTVVYQAEWAGGEPHKRSQWMGGGIHMKGVRRYSIATFRCEICGFLASYATEPLNDV